MDFWYHYEELGNVMDVTINDRTLTYSNEQDAFGNVLTGSSDGYHLTTKRLYPYIQLYYFYHRWYDPTLGRFLRYDEIKWVRKNLYLYCLNNPVNYVDPDGRIAIIGPVFGGIVIGGTVCKVVNLIQDASEAKYQKERCERAKKNANRMCKLKGWDSAICALYLQERNEVCQNAAETLVVCCGTNIPGSSVTGPPPTDPRDIPVDACQQVCQTIIGD